ncbi:MAG: MBL fold metallo-hydrolase [Acidobacteria bacterium]|nr:MBL fold metallo-hydrolase [Acidobacteriota bacterium]
MAQSRLRVPENIEGDFFVDSTCIDCDACRQLAPATFAAADDHSYVFAQPASPSERRAALQALLACPTASIGTLRRNESREVVDDFPLHIAEEVYYCGFNSPKSYGGNSYLVLHPEGNWMIDAPRYLERLARRLEDMGGVKHIFLTHRDDVAGAESYARRFGSRRIIHRLELAAQPEAERVLEGFAPAPLAPGFLAIPTPGHTRGHSALLYREKFLFTGDHLWFSRARARLGASRAVCWHSWPQQVASMASLRDFSFEWVLPGHGQRVRLDPGEMRRQLDALVADMRRAA